VIGADHQKVLYYSELHNNAGLPAGAAGSAESGTPGTLVVGSRSAFRNVHSPEAPELACAALSGHRQASVPGPVPTRRSAVVDQESIRIFQSKRRDQSRRDAGLVAQSARPDLVFPGSKQAAFAETRFRRPKPYASGKWSSGSEGRLGAVPPEWRNPTEDHAKERDGRGTCGLRFARTAEIEQSLLRLELKKDSGLHRNSCIS
jgi:hypothetical protein